MNRFFLIIILGFLPCVVHAYNTKLVVAYPVPYNPRLGVLTIGRLSNSLGLFDRYGVLGAYDRSQLMVDS